MPEQQHAPACRICLGEEDGGAEGRLFRPCPCKGTMSHVHVECLDQWRRRAANREAFYRCDQCRYRYEFGPAHRDRLSIARLLGSTPFRVVLSIAALAQVVAVAGLTARATGYGAVGCRGACGVPWRRVAAPLDRQFWIDGAVPVGLLTLAGSAAHFLADTLGAVHLPRGGGGLPSFSGGSGGGGGGDKDGAGALVAVLVVIGLLIALWYIFGVVSRYARVLLDHWQGVVLEYRDPAPGGRRAAAVAGGGRRPAAAVA